jgi:mono/diheme cytochrome c family protein/glucose/arabinose dehydrogenase
MQRIPIFLLFSTLITSALFAQQGDRKEDNKMGNIVPDELIPPAPVLTIDEALKTFTIEKGFVIEPVAAEPLIEKPVALAFDSKGRMWVCELRGYMPNVDGKDEDKPTGRIAILEDTNGDGTADKRTNFLEEIVLPRSIAVTSGGILFADQQNLYFVKSENDKPVGKPVVVDSQYAPGGNVEHKTNGLMFGIDNWMYNSKSNIRHKFIDGKIIRDKTETRGQFGITRDNLGRLYHNTNSLTLAGDRVLPNLTQGNPAVNTKTTITTKIGDNRVYPSRVTPGVNRAYMSTLNGYKSDIIDPKTFKLINVTGACSPVIYRGNQFPESFQYSAFVCEPAANLIKLVKVDAKDGKLSGFNPLNDRDFLTSSDERFRPVNLYNAPDGSIYVLDMYHGIIQHRIYVTSYLRKQILDRKLDGPGFGHGRIYRIRAEKTALEKVEDLSKDSMEVLTKKLGSPNGAVRDLAQRELIERKADPAVLASALKSPANELHTIHLIWTLEGLGALEASHLKPALASGKEDLVTSALYASLSLADSQRKLLVDDITKSIATPATLPYQAKVLATIPSPEAQEALVELLTKHNKVELVLPAVISGLNQTAKLFEETNKGRFTDKTFDQWLKQAKEGPKKETDPSTLLKGDHLASFNRGKTLFTTTAACVGCHGADGAGLENLGPHLDGSDWVNGDPQRLIRVLLHGLSGPIQLNGKTYTPLGVMPGLGQNPTIKDQDIADLATYIRANWSNRSTQVEEKTVKEIRNATKDRSAGQMYTQEDFKK